MSPLENDILALLQDPLHQAGYQLSSLALTRAKEGSKLCVVVDRVAPISLEDIVRVSDLVSGLLDENDPIEEAYTLDVSSLGAEKPIPLPELPLYAGRYVNLHLSHPYKGENILQGTLTRIEGENLVLQIRDKARKKEIAFPLKDVDRARLAIEF